MIYLKWFFLQIVMWIAEVLGLVMVPISNKLGWNKFTWAIWGNDDGEVVDFPDPRDTDRSFRWLAITNRAHNLSKLCGVIAKDYSHEGDEKVSDLGYPGRWILRQDDAFEYYLVKRVLTWLPWPLCLRIRLGWKLHGMKDRNAPIVCHTSIRRFHYKDYSQSGGE